MLDIKELNKKVTELYEQDTTFINQINDLYMRTHENAYDIKSLEVTIRDQRDFIDAQQKRIRELMPEESDTKEYRVVWRSGHLQTIFACNSSNAYAGVMKGFNGADTILSIEEPVDNGVLVMCPRCNTIINPNDTKPLDDDIVVGCGLKEGDFGECSDCGGVGDPDECRSIRRELGLSKTTARELSGSKYKIGVINDTK